jgi:hypothetical protein
MHENTYLVAHCLPLPSLKAHAMVYSEVTSVNFAPSPKHSMGRARPRHPGLQNTRCSRGVVEKRGHKQHCLLLQAFPEVPTSDTGINFDVET